MDFREWYIGQITKPTDRQPVSGVQGLAPPPAQPEQQSWWSPWSSLGLNAKTPEPELAPAPVAPVPLAAPVASVEPVPPADASLEPPANEGYSFPGFQPYTETEAGKELIKQLGDASKLGQDEAAKSLGDSQKLADLYKSLPMQLDLSPAAAMIDSWTKGNLAASYKRPETPQDKIGAMAALQQGISKSRLGLTNAQTEFLKDRLTMAQKNDDAKIRYAEAAGRAAIAGGEKAVARQNKLDTRKMTASAMFNEKQGKEIDQYSLFAAGLSKVRKAIEDNKGSVPVAGNAKLLYDQGLSQMTTSYNRVEADLGALALGDLDQLLKTLGANGTRLGAYVSDKLTTPEGRKSILNNLGVQIDAAVAKKIALSKATYGDLAKEVTQIASDNYNSAKRNYGASAPAAAKKVYTAEELNKMPREDRMKILNGGG